MGNVYSIQFHQNIISWCHTCLRYLPLLSILKKPSPRMLYDLPGDDLHDLMMLSEINVIRCDWLLNLNLIYETLVDFSAGKTQLVSFDQSNNTDAVDVKMDGSILEEK